MQQPTPMHNQETKWSGPSGVPEETGPSSTSVICGTSFPPAQSGRRLFWPLLHATCDTARRPTQPRDRDGAGRAKVEPRTERASERSSANQQQCFHRDGLHPRCSALFYRIRAWGCRGVEGHTIILRQKGAACAQEALDFPDSFGIRCPPRSDESTSGIDALKIAEDTPSLSAFPSRGRPVPRHLSRGREAQPGYGFPCEWEGAVCSRRFKRSHLPLAVDILRGTWRSGCKWIPAREDSP
jgi:hypothetical protein